MGTSTFISRRFMTLITIILILILIALVFGGDAVAGIFQFILKAGFWLLVSMIALTAFFFIGR